MVVGFVFLCISIALSISGQYNLKDTSRTRIVLLRDDGGLDVYRPVVSWNIGHPPCLVNDRSKVSMWVEKCWIKTLSETLLFCFIICLGIRCQANVSNDRV